MVPYTNRARGQDLKENYDLARSCTYDLLCVVVHVGEIDTGHYVTYCRVGDQVRITPQLTRRARTRQLTRHNVIRIKRPQGRGSEQVGRPRR